MVLVLPVNVVVPPLRCVNTPRTGGGQITCDAERCSASGRDIGSCDGEVIEIVDTAATDRCSSTR